MNREILENLKKDITHHFHSRIYWIQEADYGLEVALEIANSSNPVVFIMENQSDDPHAITVYYEDPSTDGKIILFISDIIDHMEKTAEELNLHYEFDPDEEDYDYEDDVEE